MGNTMETMPIPRAEAYLEKKVADNRERTEALLMPGYFEKHEHLIRANFLKQLKTYGIDIREATTWGKIGEIIENLFEEMCRKECVLPERAADIMITSIKRRKESKEAAKKKMAAELEFPSFEMMMKCIEMGKNFEEGKDLTP